MFQSPEAWTFPLENDNQIATPKIAAAMLVIFLALDAQQEERGRERERAKKRVK